MKFGGVKSSNPGVPAGYFRLCKQTSSKYFSRSSLNLDFFSMSSIGFSQLLCRYMCRKKDYSLECEELYHDGNSMT